MKLDIILALLFIAMVLILRIYFVEVYYIFPWGSTIVVSMINYYLGVRLGMRITERKFKYRYYNKNYKK